MNKSVKITTKKELRSAIRDKKSLMMMFVTPLFIPLFVFMFAGFFDTLLEPTTHYVGVNYELSETARAIVDELNLELKFFETDALNEAYESGDIIAYIIYDEGKYTVFSNIRSADGAQAFAEINNYLSAYNNSLAVQYLLENDINPENVFSIVHFDLEELPGNNDMLTQILFMAFVFAIISVTTTAIQSATDSTAGEKERGTLETLLTFPIRGKDLIMGKYFACLIACLVTALLCGILLYFSLFFARDMFEVFNDMVFDFSGTTIALSLVILVGYSLFISGLSIGIASLTKSHKEAQSTLMPLSMLPMIPMFINMFGVEMDVVLSLIPILNHTLLLNEIFIGNINMTHIILMLVSTAVFIVVIIRYLIAQYKSEKILFSI